MDVLWDTLGFASKSLVVFVTFVACALVLFAIARIRRGAEEPPGQLHVRRLNDSLRANAEALRGAMMDAKDYKRHVKAVVKADKRRAPPAASVFVLDFKGDLLASAVEDLREEVSALVSVAGAEDEVVVRLESAGGAAHSYGLAASQLARLRQRGIGLTVCVDRVAASGGYMMACVADRIVAAPFAIVGSIGVAAPVPNVHRLLDRCGVDYENVTAGKYKRTVSVLAEITEQGRQKFQEQIEEVHQLFKDFVHECRPSLDIDQVATGEYWHGVRAAELGLVNELMTSDDYLMSKPDSAAIYKISYKRRRSMRERLAGTVTAVGQQLFDAIRERLTGTPLT